MKKQGSEVNISELDELLETYIKNSEKLNYAIKIMGHPGVGKSAIVRQAAERLNYYFIDTRLAFKENVDLGGYPVPDNDTRQMIYYRPRFIPPEKVPEGFQGIVWFLDESNRAHPTVIQTLFQIITEGRCGEHSLPEKTAIILAGNLGDMDETTITDFDDSALDGRLSILHLKPSASDWLSWAFRENIHPSVIKYISMFPEKLWDEKNINPNPRGWHQVSNALLHSWGLPAEEELSRHLGNGSTTLRIMINSLVGHVTGDDFISQVTAPRQLTVSEILKGSEEKLEMLKNRQLQQEDILWALNGTIAVLKDMAVRTSGIFTGEELVRLSNVLRFLAFTRGDIRMTYFLMLMKECGIFTVIPAAVKLIGDEETRIEIKQRFDRVMM